MMYFTGRVTFNNKRLFYYKLNDISFKKFKFLKFQLNHKHILNNTELSATIKALKHFIIIIIIVIRVYCAKMDSGIKS